MSVAPSHARSLDGLEVSSETISRIFSIYFSKYHPFVDILDAGLSPDAYFERSRLLFWTILAIATQYSTEDATLTVALAPRVNDLAIDCLKWRDQYLDSIQALLLLLNWPLCAGYPSDITFTLAGASVHMAMQIGLHVPLSSQEFSKAKILLTDAEINQRTELWTHCLIAHGRICCMKGIAAMKTDAVSSDPETRNLINERLTLRLSYHKRLHSILMRCHLALQKNGLRKLSLDQERALEILIPVFMEQLHDIGHEAISGTLVPDLSRPRTSEADNVTEHDRLLQLIAELQCHCFIFFKLHTPIDEQELVALHTRSCQILQSAKALDESEEFLPLTTNYFRYGILLASYTLLRLLKSPFGRFLNNDARDCFLSSINMARRLSKVFGDVADKHATALTQLWNSSSVFKKTDGSDFTILRVRSRLAMSVAFDAIWWWREEFHGHSIFRDDSHGVTTTSNISSPRQLAQANVLQQSSEQWNDNSMGTMDAFDDQVFAEFGLCNQFDNDMIMGWALPSVDMSAGTEPAMPSFNS